MLHKLGLLAVALSLVLPASASAKAGSISGYVRNASGVPQMGAAVEIFSAAETLRLFTDERGFFTAADLIAGTYSVKVSAPSFLPTLHEKVRIRSGSSDILNITLNTLFEAIEFAPIRSGVDQDDWKWTLRSVANRPILRV